MTDRTKVVIDQQAKEIHFLGLAFSNRSHAKWLRCQLAIIEANGEFLWPAEEDKPDNVVQLNLVVDNTKTKGGINGNQT